jgi:broad specificity phosphatase PhoE
MSRLILVRHSISDQRPERPAASWGLTAEGVERCRPLAEQLAAYQPDYIFASVEPKASQTAAAIANHLDMSWTTAADLHEHDRSGEPFTSPEAFVRRVTNFFNQPNELVMGRETAVQAQTRFVTAVQNLIAAHPDKSLLIVAHGTVMTLLTSYFNPIAPIPFWQGLQMPDFRLYSLPDCRLIGSPSSS